MTANVHPRRPRIYLGWCSLLHIITDGHLASISLLLPFIAADLGLSYTQSGFIKAASHGAISIFQIPAGLLSERIGEILVGGYLVNNDFSRGDLSLQSQLVNLNMPHLP